MEPERADIFPLPLESGSKVHISQARCQRKRNGLGRAADGVSRALNSLSAASAGAPLSMGEPLHHRSPNQLQQQVWQSICRCVRLRGEPPDRRCRAGALQELLKCTDVYNLDRESTRRPYDVALVRVVKEGITTVPLTQMLSGHALDVARAPYAWIPKDDGEIADTPEEAFVLPYTDPALKPRGRCSSLPSGYTVPDCLLSGRCAGRKSEFLPSRKKEES